MKQIYIFVIKFLKKTQIIWKLFVAHEKQKPSTLWKAFP